jgi:hypothetical protein
MRVALLILLLATTSACKLAIFGRSKAAHTRTSQPLSVPASATNSTDTFQTKVRPILEARCQPCHFQGGKMYEQLPFDRPATIKRLGEKLFTRIKDPKEQQVIREFLGPAQVGHQ